MSFGAMSAILALLLSVAAGALKCAWNHYPDMSSQIDKLPIPASCQLLAEKRFTQNAKLFGLSDLGVARRYRSNLDFEGTCDQVAAIAELDARYVDSSRPIYSICRTKAQWVRSGWRAAGVSSYRM